MIGEVIIVEGKSDVAAIRRAVEADCLITGGFSLSPELLGQIDAAYRRRGIIIMTDPDSASGFQRRDMLLFPGRKPLARMAGLAWKKRLRNKSGQLWQKFARRKYLWERNSRWRTWWKRG